MAAVPGYPHLRYVGGAAANPAEQQDLPAILGPLDRVGAALGQVIDIFSGSGGPSVRGAGFVGDPHDRRLAVDATIRGQAIGDYPGAVAAIHAQGLRSGATDFTYHGKPDPAHVDAVASATNAANQPNQAQRVLGEILSRAYMDNLDGPASAAVASVEGGFTPGAKPGDGGTSFGPFQLHRGGQLDNAPVVGDPNRWAWSNAGIDWAVDQQAKVAGGLVGHDAIDAIVRKFERPKHPDAEVASAQAAYDAYAKGGSGSFTGGTGVVPKVTDPGLIGHALNGWDAVSHFFNVVFSARGLQVGGGFLLVILGVLWLARSTSPVAGLAPGMR